MRTFFYSLVRRMKIFLKIISTIFLAYIAFEICVVRDFYWQENIVNKLKYTNVFEFIETIYFIIAIPKLIFYFVIGWFAFKGNSKYIWLFVFIALPLEIYSITHGFTEHSTLQIKFWAYISYLFSSIAVLLGNTLKQRLTSSKTAAFNSDTSTTRIHKKRVGDK